MKIQLIVPNVVSVWRELSESIMVKFLLALAGMSLVSSGLTTLGLMPEDLGSIVIYSLTLLCVRCLVGLIQYSVKYGAVRGSWVRDMITSCIFWCVVGLALMIILGLEFNLLLTTLILSVASIIAAVLYWIFVVPAQREEMSYG